MNDPVSTSMFWVGALFAFTPIVIGGSVAAVVWWKHRRDRLGHRPPEGPEARAR